MLDKIPLFVIPLFFQFPESVRSHSNEVYYSQTFRELSWSAKGSGFLQARSSWKISLLKNSRDFGTIAVGRQAGHLQRLQRV